MLIQSLAEYADNYLAKELNDAAWEMKPVPWLLEISTQGTFLNVIPRTTVVTRGKKQVQVSVEMLMPHSPVNRNNGDHPLLAADGIAYVLGVGPWTSDKERKTTEEHHLAFIELLRKAARETGDAAIQACVQFYANPSDVERARGELRGATGKENVALSVGLPIVELSSAQQFWQQHYRIEYSKRLGENVGECIVSGTFGPIAPTHEKIKGMSSLEGRAEVGLMSFDKDAFCSYGWEKNQNSPVSPNRARAYVLALNDLLRVDKGKRKDVAGVGFLYWLRTPAQFDLWEELDPPDTDTVKALLDFDPRADLNPNTFHLVGVSGNGGRLRIRYWVTESLNKIRLNLKNWQQQLKVDYPWDDAPPVRLWQLLYALDGEGKPPAHHVLALLRRGIEGTAQPLGYSMLSTALSHLRHPGSNRPSAKEQKSDPMSLQRLRIPVGLIRMCLNDLFRQQKGKKEMSEGLDPACIIPAYVCGRLMAEFENLQRTSSESEVNSSVLDRYFVLASTYPAVAFPKIGSLGQKHLRKLRRDRSAAAYAIDGRLQELHNLLRPAQTGAYPAKLSLEGQGLFALGYYHQKAWSIAQARDRKQSNATVDQNANQEK